MSDDVSATVTAIESCLVTKDGRYAVLQASGAAGQRISLKFPEDLLNGLVVAFADASARSRRILGDDPDAQYVFGVSRFQTGGSKQGDVAVAFELPEGAELAFLLPKHWLEVSAKHFYPLRESHRDHLEHALSERHHPSTLPRSSIIRPMISSS
jgi:hypothetical protein